MSSVGYGADPSEMRLWVLWGAILMGQLVIGGVAFMILKTGGGDPGLQMPMLIPFTALAGLLGLISAATHLVMNSEDKIRESARALRTQGLSAAQAKLKLWSGYQQKMIMGLALGEGVTIFGFLLAFLRQIPFSTFLIFLGAGLILQFLGLPKIAALRRAAAEELPAA